MKKLTDYFIAILPGIFTAAIFYLLIAFVKLDIDFRNWGEPLRIVLVCILFFSWYLAYLIMGFPTYIRTIEQPKNPIEQTKNP